MVVAKHFSLAMSAVFKQTSTFSVGFIVTSVGVAVVGSVVDKIVGVVVGKIVVDKIVVGKIVVDKVVGLVPTEVVVVGGGVSNVK